MSDTSKFGFSPEILSLPNQQEYDGATFPLVLRSEAGSLGEARDWISENAGQIERQAATHGAVLLRGLPLATAENVVLTPHIGGFSERMFEQFWQLSAESVVAMAAGRLPESFTNPEAAKGSGFAAAERPAL